MLEEIFQTRFKFEYINFIGGDPDFYQFGWRDGIHFYLDDYHANEEEIDRYILIAWSNKTKIFNGSFREIEPMLTQIENILNLN